MTQGPLVPLSAPRVAAFGGAAFGGLLTHLAAGDKLPPEPPGTIHTSRSAARPDSLPRRTGRVAFDSRLALVPHSD